jgi:hypothetical protein
VIIAERAYALAAGGDLEGAITLFREEGDGYQRLLEARRCDSVATCGGY